MESTFWDSENPELIKERVSKIKELNETCDTQIFIFTDENYKTQFNLPEEYELIAKFEIGIIADENYYIYKKSESLKKQHNM